MLFQWGDFTLSAGGHSWWRIDCDAFSDSEIELFAKMIAERVGDFTHVVCPPSHPGSCPPKLVEALKKYRKEESQLKSRILLVVDDVASSFNSLMNVRAKEKAYYNIVKGAVIFSRSYINPRSSIEWVTPLFMMMPPAR